MWNVENLREIREGNGESCCGCVTFIRSAGCSGMLADTTGAVAHSDTQWDTQTRYIHKARLHVIVSDQEMISIE
jgi:ethanolamine utilization protein EutP (predicted NTPase)